MAVATGRDVRVILVREEGGPFMDISGQVTAVQTTMSANELTMVNLEMIGDGRMLHDALDIPAHEVQVYDPERKAIVKCDHCGQWAAMYTRCQFCNAPVPADYPQKRGF